jgi:transposase
MDNASIHKTKLIQDFTLSRQQSLLFIPPYSPECNPVENVFSMIKNDFRKQVILTPQKEYKDILIPIIKKLDGSLYKRCFSHMRKWVENYHLTL